MKVNLRCFIPLFICSTTITFSYIIHSEVNSENVEEKSNRRKKSISTWEDLYENRLDQIKRRDQDICKYLDEQSKEYPFKPSIPASSSDIIRKFKSGVSRLPPPPPPKAAGRSPNKLEVQIREQAWDTGLTGGRVGDRLSSPPRLRRPNTQFQEPVPYGKSHFCYCTKNQNK
jgi:hypothetical protein